MRDIFESLRDEMRDLSDAIRSGGSLTVLAAAILLAVGCFGLITLITSAILIFG